MPVGDQMDSRLEHKQVSLLELVSKLKLLTDSSKLLQRPRQGDKPPPPPSSTAMVLPQRPEQALRLQ